MPAVAGELERVDALLDDPTFFAPFVPFFDPALGRPSIPLETYLRLMFLKYRYRLGYESLCREVADSISWRRFARIPFDSRVPHPTTLMKITTRCGEAAVAGLNEALLAKAAAAKLLRTARVRADTTVIPANVAYPTDSGLLAKAVGKLARTVARIKAAGGGDPMLADRRRSAGRRPRQIAGKLRNAASRPGRRHRRDAPGDRGTDWIAKSAADAAAVLRNGRRALPRMTAAGAGDCIEPSTNWRSPWNGPPNFAGQARTRLVGQVPDGATRLVSLHDPDARPIRKGRIDRPVEFGYKAQMVDNDDGVVLDHSLEAGNPPDAPQLAPSMHESPAAPAARPAPSPLTAATATPVERDLHALGVRTMAIPRKANQHRAPRDRTPANLPRHGEMAHRMRRTDQPPETPLRLGPHRTRRHQGARTWCGHGVFTHNLVKIGHSRSIK